MELPFGKRTLTLGDRYLGTVTESTDLLGEPGALRERMKEDGYLLLRGLHDPQTVRAARASILEKLEANGQLDPAFPRDAAVAVKGGRGAFLGGSKEVTRTPEFLGLVESPHLKSITQIFVGSLPGAPPGEQE